MNQEEKDNLKGKRVRLISMDDVQAPPSGTEGTVHHVDSINQIHVKWDNGSTLALIPENDQYKILD